MPRQDRGQAGLCGPLLPSTPTWNWLFLSTPVWGWFSLQHPNMGLALPQDCLCSPHRLGALPTFIWKMMLFQLVSLNL